jgi:uncharacterized protein (TIGR02145 family)
LAGNRYRADGSLTDAGSFGWYWSSTVNGPNSITLLFSSGQASMTNGARSNGYSVRCIKD